MRAMALADAVTRGEGFARPGRFGPYGREDGANPTPENANEGRFRPKKRHFTGNFA
jgi:hypothetical protein